MTETSALELCQIHLDDLEVSIQRRLEALDMPTIEAAVQAGVQVPHHLKSAAQAPDAARIRASLAHAATAIRRARAALMACPDAAEAVYQAVLAFMFGQVGRVTVPEYRAVLGRSRGRRTQQAERRAKAQDWQTKARHDAAAIHGTERAKVLKLKRLRNEDGTFKYPQQADYLRRIIRKNPSAKRKKRDSR
jgi:hypothetical protein